MNNTNNNIEYINIDNKLIATGLEWKKGSSKVIFKWQNILNIKKEAKHSFLYYGAYLNKSNQYFLLSEQESKDAIIGGALIVDHINEWLDDDPLINEFNETITFIKNIDDNENSLNQRFWLCCITSDGEILNNYEKVINDEYELKTLLDSLTLTDKLNICYLDNETNIETLINDYKQNNILSNIKVSTISSIDFHNDLEKIQPNITQLYKPSKIKIKKIGLITGVSISLFAMFIGYSYISQLESFNFFSDIKNYNKYLRASDNLYTLNKKNKPTKYWNERSFKLATSQEFINDIKKSHYNSIQITNTFKKIEDYLPLYAAEWKMSKIKFTQNKFTVYYERIDGTKTVFFFLDEIIKKTTGKITDLTVLPLKLTNFGNTRVYSIIPKITLIKKNKADNIGKYLSQSIKVNEELSKQQQTIITLYNELVSTFDTYKILSVTDKIFKFKVKSLYEKAKKIKKTIPTEIKKLNQIKLIKNKRKPFNINQNMIVGNVMDFVTMMQLDSLFDWSFPKLSLTYPNKKTLKKHNKKINKNKKYKAGFLYLPAIEEYDVEISTQTKDKDGKIKSAGILDMLELGYILNKPYIQIDVVEYLTDNEQWKFGIHFYKKTNEYNFRHLENNKD